eukprot:TRINITY_DN4156_c0_g1_i5.p1 TRINITY_DN4156_c0_g1~~TRINITY_DN4156_c0_g1_i5.p1  ORF type:complete len:181 (+),score=22.04 TRINITY_DN4156_c0_g1_i5:86-628(+)
MAGELHNLSVNKALPRLRANDPTLTRLDLSAVSGGKVIGPGGVQRLADVLRGNTVVEELHLAKHELGPDGAGRLLGALRGNTTLKVLNLGENGIGEEGMGRIVDGLRGNKTLERLHLSRNKIGAKGAGLLWDGLERASLTLKELNLDVRRGERGRGGMPSLSPSFCYYLFLPVGFPCVYW